MGKKFNKGTKKTSFLNSIPQETLEMSNIASRCKFNFSYLDISQQHGKSLIDWNEKSGNSLLVKLNEKLKHYSKEPLEYWKNEPVGKGKKGGDGARQHVLEIYGDFPDNSAFIHPRHVPLGVNWGRFRLESDARLAGFVIPDNLAEKVDCNGCKFDINTFYVVFLDEHHKFYLTK